MTKTIAIHSRRFAKGAALTLCAATLIALPAHAQQTVTDDTVTAREVAMTPLSDLNLSRDPIPTVLVQARANPYTNEGYNTCSALRSEIGDLDAVLGDDFDTAQPEDRELTPGRVAQSVVGFFIPFRGIIREVSGANKHEYEFREAIAAGLMRRAYLKGLGQAMDCPYPARPAPPELVDRLRASAEREAAGTESENETAATGEDEAQFVSRPVVQSTD